MSKIKKTKEREGDGERGRGGQQLYFLDTESKILSKIEKTDHGKFMTLGS